MPQTRLRLDTTRPCHCFVIKQIGDANAVNSAPIAQQFNWHGTICVEWELQLGHCITGRAGRRPVNRPTMSSARSISSLVRYGLPLAGRMIVRSANRI